MLSFAVQVYKCTEDIHIFVSSFGVGIASLLNVHGISDLYSCLVQRKAFLFVYAAFSTGISLPSGDVDRNQWLAGVSVRETTPEIPARQPRSPLSAGPKIDKRV